MFEYPGMRIKLIARMLFWAILGVAIVLAIVLGFSKDWRGHLKFHAIPFFASLCSGSIMAATSGLFLFGYGELIESTQSTAESMSELTELMQKLVENTADPQKKEAAHTPVPTKTNKTSAFCNPAPTSDENGWTLCKKCGQSQRNNRITCFNCGERLE